MLFRYMVMGQKYGEIWRERVELEVIQ